MPHCQEGRWWLPADGIEFRVLASEVHVQAAEHRHAIEKCDDYTGVTAKWRDAKGRETQ